MLEPDWQPVIWALAVLTLLVGSVLAIVQTDVKRMLAYSSISHAGYILVGLQAASDRGIAGSLFYLLAYTFMVIGSLRHRHPGGPPGRRRPRPRRLQGPGPPAGRRSPCAFTVLLLAQAGVPFTTRLPGQVLRDRRRRREPARYALALIAMLAAVVAAFLYLRIIITMYSPAEDDDVATRLAVPFGAGLALVTAVAFTLIAGILPDRFIDFARAATLLF